MQMYLAANTPSAGANRKELFIEAQNRGTQIPSGRWNFDK